MEWTYQYPNLEQHGPSAHPLHENPLPHVPSLVVGSPPGVGVGRADAVDVVDVVGMTGGSEIKVLEVANAIDVVDEVDVLEVVGVTTIAGEVVGGRTTTEDDDTTRPQEPYNGLHPTPQYSIEFPQYQYGEQH